MADYNAEKIMVQVNQCYILMAFARLFYCIDESIWAFVDNDLQLHFTIKFSAIFNNFTVVE